MTRARPFVIGAIVLIVGVAIYNYFNPAIDAGLRLIGRKADSHEIAKVGQAEPKIQAKVGGDDREFGDTIKQFGSEDGARRADREAALARARNVLPIVRQNAVLARQQTWLTFFTANEPILVMVPASDEICTNHLSPNECAHADGMYKRGTPDIHKYSSTVLQTDAYDRDLERQQLVTEGYASKAKKPENYPPGNYIALIARVCRGNECGRVYEVDSTFAVCGRGDVQLWTNGYNLIGPLRHVEDWARFTGQFRFEALLDQPEAREACRSHPNQDFVRLNRERSP